MGLRVRSFQLLSFLVMLACQPRALNPQLLTVEPSVFDNSIGGSVTLNGADWVPLVTVDFDTPSTSKVEPVAVSAFLANEFGRIDLADVQWVDSTRITALVPPEIEPGVYDVHVVDPRGHALVLAQALEMTQCAWGACEVDDGGVPDSGVSSCSNLNFADEDDDGFGTGLSQPLCGPGWVPLPGDCDDGDPLTRPTATEVCNGSDDNCNGMVDEGRCSDAGWSVSGELPNVRVDFTSVSSFAPGALWVVGESNVFLRQSDTQRLVDKSATCPMTVSAIAAHSSGQAAVAGGSSNQGQLSEVSANAACAVPRSTPFPMVAAVAFSDAQGPVYFGAQRDGQLYRWRSGETPTLVAAAPRSLQALTDVHGRDASALFAVGSTKTGNSERSAVWRFVPGTPVGRWVAESIPNKKVTLRGLWVNNSTSILAVGDEGLILRKDKNRWSQVDSNTKADLTSVRAFSRDRFYITQSDGQVRARINRSWRTVVTAPSRLNDIGGVAEDDLWVVGRGGFIGRGPQ